MRRGFTDIMAMSKLDSIISTIAFLVGLVIGVAFVVSGVLHILTWVSLLIGLVAVGVAVGGFFWLAHSQRNSPDNKE
jgi:high-affinity Fe2+/Pb2+ permease